MHNDPPHGLPSHFSMVLVFAANPMGPSFIKTVVGGAVLHRSPQLRLSATSILKDHADRISVKFLLESETRSSRLLRPGLGFAQPVVSDTGRYFPIRLLRCLRCQNPTDLSKTSPRLSRIFGKPIRSCISEILGFCSRLWVF